MNEKIRLLDLPFKGDRDYLHGTDLLPALLKITEQVTDLSFRIHKVTSTIPQAQIVRESDISLLRSSDKLCALMTYNRFAKRMVIAISETNQPITSRLNYDETEITRGADIYDKTIVQDVPVTGSFIERTVALNKQLLNAVVNNNPWLFSRIDLTNAPINPRNLSLRLMHEIGSRSYQSGIISDGICLGKIYFSKSTT